MFERYAIAYFLEIPPAIEYAYTYIFNTEYVKADT